MAAKPKTPKKPQTEKFPRKGIPLYQYKDEPEEDTARRLAGIATSADFAAYRVIGSTEAKSGIGEHIDTPTLLAELRDQAKAVNNGDMTRAEAMLMNQATALQSLFSRLAERAMGHDSISGFEANMRYALRAQSQCRATLETLATIKNPPIVYARQANITSGPQQVNNGVSQSGLDAATHPREKQIEQSKLSEVSNELLPDTRTSQEESRVNPPVEAVGESNRAEVGRG